MKTVKKPTHHGGGRDRDLLSGWIVGVEACMKRKKGVGNGAMGT